MKRILIVGLLLIVPGCVDPVIPDELKAVLDDQAAFSETAEVVHEGNLDGLPGCWGSYLETDDGIEAYAEFVEFGQDEWRHEMYWRVYSAATVLVEEGVYTLEDETTVRVVINNAWGSDPYTGELVPDVSAEYPMIRQYRHVSLEGDRMSLFPPEAEEYLYNGTYWRFSECP